MLSTPSQDIRIACLCAAWCGTCREVQPVLEAACAGLPLRWIDIEDEADLVGDVDIETFPTLLVMRGPQLLFFGPVLPQAETLARLVAAWRSESAAPMAAPDPAVAELAQRLATA